jgi:hypothetical protein
VSPRRILALVAIVVIVLAFVAAGVALALVAGHQLDQR